MMRLTSCHDCMISVCFVWINPPKDELLPMRQQNVLSVFAQSVDCETHRPQMWYFLPFWNSLLVLEPCKQYSKTNQQVYNMPREAEPSLNERQFFTRALQENTRLDGRAIDQYRALELEFGDEYGISDVRLGKTRSAYQAYSLFLPF